MVVGERRASPAALETEREPHRRLWQLLILGIPVALLVVLAWQHRWVGDDAFIDFRIVKEMKAGHGPVFNPGERVEAGTSPLWLIILFVTDVVTPLRLEWIAVLLGLGLTTAALVFAQRGASMLVHTVRPGVFVVPFGALVLALLPPMWDFATSGLETGLSFAWLGACFWALVCAYRGAPVSSRGVRTRPSLWFCVLISLGPLVRPDFAIYSVAFAVAVFVISPGARWLDRWLAVAALLALPIVSELFRMAYYAMLVPNTALAKEGGLANWPQGWRYFNDFVTPYWLWFPFLVVAVVVVTTLLWSPRGRDIRRIAVVAAPIVGALVHATYVVRVGGDFMHARMLLPATFAALLPVSVIAFEAWLRIAALAIAAWALICGLALRDTRPGRFIAVERNFWVRQTGVAHPVTVDDFRKIPGYKNGERARALEASRQRSLSVIGTEVPLGPQVRWPAVVQAGSVGVAGYLSPTDVYVVDALGLADPIDAHLHVLEPRGRPGHEKLLSLQWILARFGDESIPTPGVVSARDALACGDLHLLMTSISGPLGVGDMIHNIWNANRLTRFRVPPDAPAAQQRLCRPGRAG